MYSFDDSKNSQNIRNGVSIASKIVLIFPKNFHNFRLDLVVKHGIMNLGSSCSKSYTYLCSSL